MAHSIARLPAFALTCICLTFGSGASLAWQAPPGPRAQAPRSQTAPDVIVQTLRVGESFWQFVRGV